MVKKLFLRLFIVFSVAILLNGCAASNDTKFTDRDDVQQFIQYMVDKHQFTTAQLTSLFNQVQLRPQVITTMEAPYEAKPWYIYRAHFLSAARISGGVKFWVAHQDALNRATHQYGVPQRIIVAIIGVESNYGLQKGKYSVLDTLSTLGFDYPRRSSFFRKELEQFLLLCREEKWDPTKVLGSYAGAVGQPQFMPSSYRAYAVDFSHDGNIDLFDNINDVIGSVASYLNVHGWKANELVAVPAKTAGEKYLQLTIPPSKKPELSIAALAQYGVHPVDPLPKHTKVFPIRIETAEDQYQYWLGFNNFYVITRYNTSQLYALAVSQLSDAIEKSYKQQMGK